MSHRRASSPEARAKRRLSVTEDEEAEKRPRSENTPLSIGPTVVPREGNATPPQASSPTSSVGQEIEPSESVSVRQGYSSSAASSPSSSQGGDHSRPPTHRSSAAPRGPKWQTDSSRPDQREWPNEQRGPTAPASDEGRDLLDPREAAHGRRDDRRSPSGASFTSATALVQPPPKTQAAFVGKLYTMLEDEKIRKSGLLHWSQDGTSFVCPNPTEFSKEVLPNYFKHNNWQSFVRQLNMYSFNKVSDLYSTSNTDPQAWEFRHPHFRRGEPQLLATIKRKSNRQNHDNQGHVQATSMGPSPGEEEHKPALTYSSAPPAVGHRYNSPPRREYPNTRSYYAPPRPLSEDYEGLHQSPMPTAVPPPPRSRQYPNESPVRSEPPFASASSAHTSSYDSMSHQVAALQDTVHKLWTQVNAERAESAHNQAELLDHLLRQNEWLLMASRELRLPHDEIRRQGGELHQRYEMLSAMSAGEMLSSMASTRHAPSTATTHSQAPPRMDERGVAPAHGYDPRPPSAYERVPPGYEQQRGSYDVGRASLQPPMGDPRDPRDPRTAHSVSSRGARTPPVTQDRRISSVEHLSYSPRSYPARPAYAEFRYRPAHPMTARDQRERELGGAGPRQLPRRVTEPLPTVDDLDQPKASLRNLLH